MELRVKLWLEQDGKMAFGEGLWELLSQIERSGSISGAAASMGLAYREAWGRLRQAESTLGRPLLARRAGGAGGGGTRLTAFGRSLMETYGTLRRELEACAGHLAETHLR